LSSVLTTALTGRPPNPVTSESPNRQSMLQFITRTPEGEELVASALKESILITSDRRRNALVVSAPIDSMNLLARIIDTLDSEAPQLAKIKVFKLQNADARQMADVLVSLFRLRAGKPASHSIHIGQG
jgi:general secretion pathway protein D